MAGIADIGGSADIMTNEQFEGILNMIMQILEGCDDLETAKKRIKKVYPGKHGKSDNNININKN